MSDRPDMNTGPVPSSDPLHSMQLLTEAETLLRQAEEMTFQALKMVRNEWEWHRPDQDWKLPEIIEQDAHAAIKSTRAFRSALHWTANGLRKRKLVDAPEQQP